MRLDALLEMGAAERLAAEREAAELQRVVEQLRADGLAAEDKRFREWLGELVEDLEIEGPRYKTKSTYVGEFVSWEIRPTSWRLEAAEGRVAELEEEQQERECWENYGGGGL